VERSSMSNILIFLQHEKGILPKSTLVAIDVASQLKAAWKKDQICGVCLGPGAGKAAEAALEYGLNQVVKNEDTVYEKYLAMSYAEATKAAITQTSSDTLVGATTSHTRDFFPRVAAALEAGQASDILAVNSDGSLKRPMFAGDILADVEILSDKKVVTARASAFKPAEKSSKTGSVADLSVSIDSSKIGEVISYEISKSERPELSDAAIVVSGGRALQSTENFEKYIYPLADALGAAIGASRAAVDSGYVPNDWQVGQTGKVVAPTLYIAIGISGAIQHLAGMKDSKTIIAINKDAEAPIFELADYGLVADLYEVLPKLTEGIKQAKSK
jgi:electron transfer flavoprotein alpha subunit